MIILVVTYLFLKSTLTKEQAEAPPSIKLELHADNEEKLSEVEEISNLLYQEGGLFELVNNYLKAKGYAFQMLLSIYSEDDIRVKYVLQNQDATESIQEEITSIFYEFVENYHLDSNTFNLIVSDKNDRSDW